MTEREMIRTVRLLKIHRSIKYILAIAFIVSAIYSSFQKHFIVVEVPDTGTVMIIEKQRRYTGDEIILIKDHVCHARIIYRR